MNERWQRYLGKFLCLIGEHTDGKPWPLHWHEMTCKRCGKKFFL